MSLEVGMIIDSQPFNTNNIMGKRLQMNDWNRNFDESQIKLIMTTLH